MIALKIIALLFDLALLPIIALTILMSYITDTLRISSRGPSRGSVVLLHGSAGNHMTLALGAWILSRHGFTTHTVQYDKIFVGSRDKGILHYANDVREFIKLRGANNEISLIGHGI